MMAKSVALSDLNNVLEEFGPFEGELPTHVTGENLDKEVMDLEEEMRNIAEHFTELDKDYYSKQQAHTQPNCQASPDEEPPAVHQDTPDSPVQPVPGNTEDMSHKKPGVASAVPQCLSERHAKADIASNQFRDSVRRVHEMCDAFLCCTIVDCEITSLENRIRRVSNIANKKLRKFTEPYESQFVHYIQLKAITMMHFIMKNKTDPSQLVEVQKLRNTIFGYIQIIAVLVEDAKLAEKMLENARNYLKNISDQRTVLETTTNELKGYNTELEELQTRQRDFLNELQIDDLSNRIRDAERRLEQERAFQRDYKNTGEDIKEKMSTLTEDVVTLTTYKQMLEKFKNEDDKTSTAKDVATRHLEWLDKSYEEAIRIWEGAIDEYKVECNSAENWINFCTLLFQDDSVTETLVATVRKFQIAVDDAKDAFMAMHSKGRECMDAQNVLESYIDTIQALLGEDGYKMYKERLKKRHEAFTSALEMEVNIYANEYEMEEHARVFLELVNQSLKDFVQKKTLSKYTAYVKLEVSKIQKMLNTIETYKSNHASICQNKEDTTARQTIREDIKTSTLQGVELLDYQDEVLKEAKLIIGRATGAMDQKTSNGDKCGMYLYELRELAKLINADP